MTEENKVSKRQERREKAQQKEKANRLRTMGLIVAGVAILVFLFISQQLKPIAGIVAAPAASHPSVDRNSQGDPKARVQIVEFSDFQCPYCKHFNSDTEPALEEYFVKTGKILLTYRSAGNWVSHNIGGAKTESQDAALAAYCAGDQNKFWEMHDALFANNRDAEDQGSFTGKRLTAIAESVKLDMKTYQSCYDSGKYSDQVQKDFDDATAAGITGTPFFLMTYKVNGETKTEKIEGAQPITVFQQKIEAALLVADK